MRYGTNAKRWALALLMQLTVGSALAQDQEEGPVDLPTSEPAEGRVEAQGSAGGSAEWGSVYQPKQRSEEEAGERQRERTTEHGVAGPLRIYGGFRLDVGGGFTLWDTDDFLAIADATPAIQLGVDYVLARYFALGAETRFNWVRAKGRDERVMLWDLALKPRVRFQSAGSSWEVYGALPVGLTVANFPDLDPEVTGKANATLGLSAGVFYFLGEHFGLNAEMGWLWHWVRADYGTPVGVQTQRLGQFTLLNLNLVYAF